MVARSSSPGDNLGGQWSDAGNVPERTDHLSVTDVAYKSLGSAEWMHRLTGHRAVQADIRTHYPLR